MLEIKKLSVESKNRRKLLDNVSFKLRPKDLVVLEGPNGSGKTTLASVIMGNKDFSISKASQILLNKKNIIKLSPDKRAKLGLFMSFQFPPEIPGLKYYVFLRNAYIAVNDKYIEPEKFWALLLKISKKLEISEKILKRDVNVGFSGGEKKKMELLQLLLLEPKYAILDEIDSGTDQKFQKILLKNIKHVLSKGTGILLITHQKAFLKKLKPTAVFSIADGRIIEKNSVKK